LNANSLLLIASAVLSAGLAVIVLFRKGRSISRFCFCLGMLLFASESASSAMAFNSVSTEGVRFWQAIAVFLKACVPAVWLPFSLSYSRGNYREYLRKWRATLIVACLLPLCAGWVLHQGALEVIRSTDTDADVWIRFGATARVLNGFLLVGTVLILMNLERTFRAAVGTMQWRIKFLILGLAVIFGVRLYTRSQMLLFSGYEPEILNLEAVSLLLGGGLMGLGYLRAGFGEIDIYPSRAVLHTSFTVLLAGGYLFVVGILAQVVARRGEPGNFRLQALLVLGAVALLALLLLSDRLRQKMQHFISRHFRRPQHDFRQVWTVFTGAITSAVDEAGICTRCARAISSTFNALSVSLWLFDDQKERLILSASTAQKRDPSASADVALGFTGIQERLPETSRPFDLERAREDWAETVRGVTASEFRKGGNRVCLPLVARERWLGVIVLADRVSGLPYTSEELDLLQCIGDQIATALLNARLTDEILRGRELEAFRTMSAFFVHDLKNVASALTLMLQNLPLHFDSADFREDALRGIGKTVLRMNELIRRLGALRTKVEINSAAIDLNELIEEALRNTVLTPPVAVLKADGDVPEIMGDRQQLESVITNLLLNAADAVGPNGKISLSTSWRPGWATIAVTDNGRGMSAAFVRDSLFRPFHSTKKNGLGIGMFQAKMIVEAHGGSMHVQSEPGVGTTFRVVLPLPATTQ
jgi:putative PEP-CTERM system histidine kinase